MKKTILSLTVLFAVLVAQEKVAAQGFLKKLKDKANQVANQVVDKKVDQAVGNTTGTTPSGPSNTGGMPSSGSSSTGSKAYNTGGEGLKNTTPPDVNQQISDAEKANDTKNYSDARYSIQQALLGVELQMGKEILKSLPDNVSGLAKDTTQDRVMSTHWGWNNLTIQRIYKKDSKEFSTVVGNNSFYSGWLELYFNGTYAQSNGETQNMKQIRVKGYKAVIKFDKNEGYTVLIPLGQSSLVTFNGINFATEQEMTTAVNGFDIDGIKKMLGEQ